MEKNGVKAIKYGQIRDSLKKSLVSEIFLTKLNIILQYLKK